MSLNYLLDSGGDTPLAVGMTEVCTEADFLREALGAETLLIRGRLSTWAQAFAQGRGISYQVVHSPLSEMQQLFPNLTGDLLGRLLARWPDLSVPTSLKTLGATLMGGTSLGSTEHAAQWLLARLNLDEEGKELLSAVGPALAEAVAEEWQPVYLLPDTKLPHILLTWLGLETGVTWPVAFPVTLSGAAEAQVRQAIAHAVAQSGPSIFASWQEHGAPREVLRLAALETVQRLQAHPDELTPPILSRLRDHLTPQTYQQLTASLALPPPSLPLGDPSCWAEWMMKEYLPYRTSKQADAKALLPILRAFAENFLQAYVAAVNVGTYADYLVWQRSAALRQSDKLTLVAICDGLSLHDLELLQGHLAQFDTAQRLSSCGVQVAFPALPTITHQAKPALVKGVAPTLTAAAKPLGPMSTQEGKVAEALQVAGRGDIVFWNYVKTDKLYHESDTLSQARAETNATLMFLAGRLLDLMLNVIPKDVPAQLVITSDHGRLLSEARRTITPPTNFRPESRAAFGDWGSIPAAGFEVGEHYAMLGRTRFGLNEDAAVMWDAEMFLMANGATGSEVCPHGGIAPEEVLIPWVVYVRDFNFRLPTFEVTGKGTAEDTGTLHIQATNTSALTLSVVAAQGSLAKRLGADLPLPWQLAPHSVSKLEIPLASWPNASETSALTLSLSVRAGEAAAQDISASIQLESEAMYVSSHDDMLDDLL